MSADLSEICRIESEVNDLAATLRVMLRLRVPQARGLFRDIFHKNRDINAEDVFGSILMLLSEMTQPFDADQVTRLCEKKLSRAVRFGRLVKEIPESKIVAAWNVYDATEGLADTFFTTFNFSSALDDFSAIQGGSKPTKIH
jgi:hypothetical protein